MQYWKDFSEILKNYAQFGAFLAAAVFFAVKVVRGWLASNMDVGLSLKRVRKDKETDYLIIDLTLKKGDKEAAWLQSMKLTIDDGKGPYDGDWRDHYVQDAKRGLRLAPGESTQFSSHCEVNSGSICRVEVVIYALSGFIKEQWGKGGFWKATAISLPIVEEKPIGTPTVIAPETIKLKRRDLRQPQATIEDKPKTA